MSTVGTWYLGTSIMKKYFTVLDVNEKVLPQKGDFVSDKPLYLGIAECTKHMERMNNYWTNWHDAKMDADKEKANRNAEMWKKMIAEKTNTVTDLATKIAKLLESAKKQ